MRDIPAQADTWGGFMQRIAFLSRSLSKGKIRLVQQAALTALICVFAATALAQPTPAEQQAPKPPAPRESPLPAVAQLGPPPPSLSRVSHLLHFRYFLAGRMLKR